MAGNISGLHVFANDVGPVPLALLDQNYDALVVALNTLSTFSNFYADTGTTNQLTVNAAQHQFVSYTDGLTITVRVAATNTGASTLNVNGLGAQPILTSIGSELQPNALVAGSMVTFVYNAQRSAWQIASGSGGGQITMPFMVTNAAGEAAFAIFPDGSGTLGSPGPCGLDWDANCNFWFSAGAGIRSMFAPFTVSGPNGEPLLNVATPVAGSGDCLVTIGPGSAGAIQSGPVLCLDGMVNYPVLQVRGATHTQAEVYVANFAASCAAPGFSNGIWIAAGTNASDFALIVENCAAVSDPPNKQQFFHLAGDGSGALGPDPNRLEWDSAGHFTLTGTATLPMPPLIDLPGINITNPQNGEALVYDQATNSWVNGAPVNALAALNDVALATPANGQTLTYNAATQRWVNSTPVTLLPQLSDVHIAGPASGQVLTYSVSPQPGWVNATIPGYTFLTNLGVGPNPAPGWVLTWDGAAWVGAAPGEVAQFPLSSLTDVGITTPLNRQVLTYDAPSGKWINAPAAAPSLATLPDVSLTGQTQGQVLAWDATLNRWVNSPLPGGSVIALDTLMDTNISDPQNNQVLTWNYAQSRWVNATPVTALSALTDVTLTSPASGQTLVWNGTHWVNQTPVSVTVAATPPANPQSGWLWWDTVGGQMYVYFANQWVLANVTTPPVFPTATAGTLWTSSGSGWVPGGSAIITAATGTIGLTVTGAAGQYTTQFTAPNSASASFGPSILAGTDSSDYSFSVSTYAGGGTNLMRLFGDGTGNLGPNATNRLSWSTAGNFYISAPTSGSTLTVQGQDGQTAFNVNGLGGTWISRIINTNTAGTSYGLLVQAGLTANDFSFYVASGSSAVGAVFYVRGNGGVFMPAIGQSPTQNYPLHAYAGGQILMYNVNLSAGRHKRNIRTMTRQRVREIVKALRVVSFTWDMEHGNPDQERYGLIAEEVEKVDSRLVEYTDDGKLNGVQYAKVAMLMLPLVRELLGMDEPEGVY